MSIGEKVAHQVIVPAYVWSDNDQRAALLVYMGKLVAQGAARSGERVDLDEAMVEPFGMVAKVAHAEIADGGKPVGFVAYDACDVEHADLVCVVVTAPVVPA